MAHPKVAEKKRIAQLVDDLGLVAAAKALPIHHSVLTRVLAGIPVRPSTVSKLRAGLAKALDGSAQP